MYNKVQEGKRYKKKEEEVKEAGTTRINYNNNSTTARSKNVV
jgi:hypothetical protein